MATPETCPIAKLETILLATDATEFSAGAVREAIAFASSCSSRLSAVLAEESNPEYETTSPQVFEQEERREVEHLETVKSRAAEAGVPCDAVILRGGEVSHAIVHAAAKRNADLIVIGRHGHRGLAKALVGEIAAKVIARAACMVLVVPRAATITYRNILVATDGSAHATAAVAEAIAIAKRRGSHLIALSATPDESERAEAAAFAQRAVEMAQAQGVSAEPVTPEGRPAAAIVETAGGRGVDLIVMGAYGRTGLKKLLMGSATETVIGTAGCAVLVVRATEEQREADS
jgi:nucleotide-binding universal stress UspA family protein